jgi:hypothetical protein
LLAPLSAGCLPKDTRPPPSRVLFTASPSAAVAQPETPTQTEDGWQVSFKRVLITIGRASIDGDACNSYSEARYTRVLSLLGAPAQEKISESFALGHCDFGFAVINAENDSLLGSTATAEDLSFLRTLGEDKYAGPSGISFYVEGEAAQGDSRKTFAWKFRGRMRLQQCAEMVDGKSVQGLDLAQDGAVSVDVTLAPERIFADGVDPDKSKLRFAAIAAADTEAGNADGEVTLDELGLVPFDALTSEDAYAPASADSGLTFTTLEDFVYLGVAPTVARYRGTGKCQAQLRPARGGGGPG